MTDDWSEHASQIGKVHNKFKKIREITGGTPP